MADTIFSSMEFIHRPINIHTLLGIGTNNDVNEYRTTQCD